MKVMKNNPPEAEKATTFSACDVVPPSKRIDYLCLSSGKAKNILIILYILSKNLKGYLRKERGQPLT